LVNYTRKSARVSETCEQEKLLALLELGRMHEFMSF